MVLRSSKDKYRETIINFASAAVECARCGFGTADKIVFRAQESISQGLKPDSELIRECPGLKPGSVWVRECPG